MGRAREEGGSCETSSSSHLYHLCLWIMSRSGAWLEGRERTGGEEKRKEEKKRRSLAISHPAQSKVYIYTTF